MCVARWPLFSPSPHPFTHEDPPSPLHPRGEEGVTPEGSGKKHFFRGHLDVGIIALDGPLQIELAPCAASPATTPSPAPSASRGAGRLRGRMEREHRQMEQHLWGGLQQVALPAAAGCIGQPEPGIALYNDQPISSGGLEYCGPCGAGAGGRAGEAGALGRTCLAATTCKLFRSLGQLLAQHWSSACTARRHLRRVRSSSLSP